MAEMMWFSTNKMVWVDETGLDKKQHSKVWMLSERDDVRKVILQRENDFHQWLQCHKMG